MILLLHTNKLIISISFDLFIRCLKLIASLVANKVEDFRLDHCVIALAWVDSYRGYLPLIIRQHP